MNVTIEPVRQTAPSFRFHFRVQLIDGSYIQGRGIANMGARHFQPKLCCQHSPG